MTGGLSSGRNLRIAVVGAGVGGLSAAWLLSRGHHVSLFEQARYLGGHSNTVEVPGGEAGSLPVDTGFIVYNEVNYPNLVQLFKHLGVATAASDMSFAVSLRGGNLEYAGTNLAGLFAQPGNLLKPRFWRMLSDLRRFYRDSSAHRVEAARDRQAHRFREHPGVLCNAQMGPRLLHRVCRPTAPATEVEKSPTAPAMDLACEICHHMLGVGMWGLHLQGAAADAHGARVLPWAPEDALDSFR